MNQIKKRESNLEKSIGKWVSINIAGNGSVQGKVKKVNFRDVTLKSYKGLRYNLDKGCNLYKIVYEKLFVEISPNGYILEIINKETLDYHIQESNKNILESKKTII